MRMFISRLKVCVRSLVLSFLGCASVVSETGTAGDKAIEERILFYDDTYSVRVAGDVGSAVSYFTAYDFKLMKTPQLLTWLEGKIKNGSCSNSVVLQISDVTPKELVEPWDKTSPLYLYCENGGRWVAPSGNTLYAFEGATDFNIFQQNKYVKDADKYITKCFGIHPVYGLKGKGAELTSIGMEWGLSAESDKWIKRLTLGMPAKDVTPLVSSKEGDAALLWQKKRQPRPSIFRIDRDVCDLERLRATAPSDSSALRF